MPENDGLDLAIDIDAVGLPAEAVALEQRSLDEQSAAAWRSSQDTLLIVMEMDVSDCEVATFDSNAGAILVTHRDAGALDALDHHVVRFDHQGGFALYGVATQVSAGLAAQDQTGRPDDCALFVDAGGEHHLVARERRCYRLLQAVVTAVGLILDCRADPQDAAFVGASRAA